jgi:hypothetical protein
MLIAIVAAQIAELGKFYDEYRLLHITAPQLMLFSDLVPRYRNLGRKAARENLYKIGQGSTIKITTRKVERN